MATIDDLVAATTDLLDAVNVSKTTLDNSVLDAEAAQTAAEAAQATVQSIASALTAVSGATGRTLSVAEVTCTQIDNIGQGAAAVDLQLPAAQAGLNFVLICGEAQTSQAWRVRAGAADKVYLDGVAGSDNGYVGIASPVVGAYISFFTFKTGASAWDWMAVVGSGNWAVI